MGEYSNLNQWKEKAIDSLKKLYGGRDKAINI